jgi:hypothetical protein
MYYSDSTARATGHERAASTDVSIGDWDTLFRAVIFRLRESSNHGQVLECVAALDQLHATVAHHIERADALQTALSDARAALAEAHGEAARAQAGESIPQRRAARPAAGSLPHENGADRGIDE